MKVAWIPLFIVTAALSIVYGESKSSPTIYRGLKESSAFFLGAPYSGNPENLSRNLADLPEFDCMTLLESSLAIALSNSSSQYDAMLKNIRYYNGTVSEATRRHFVSVDWLPYLIENRIIEDITTELFPEFSRINRTISKLSWFEKTKSMSDTEAFKESGLPHQLKGSLSYIPIEKLFYEKQEKLAIFSSSVEDKGLIYEGKVARLTKLAQSIPDSAILTFIPHNPDNYIEIIGSPLLVSHIGILIHKDDDLYIRHADLPRSTVLDLKLTDFLRSNSNKFLGIHVSRLRT